MTTRLVDRSRIISYSTCKRLRFLNYEALGTGIVPVRTNVALSTGSAIHKGVELLLLGNNVDKAVEVAISEYTDLVKSKELELEMNEDQLFVFNEQYSLIEALIRVYEKIQLPKLLSEYEVLEVEKEILYPLVNEIVHGHNCDHTSKHILEGTDLLVCDGSLEPSITLMSKPDAILRDKSTGGLVVYSLKTSSSWNDTNEKANRFDIQGLSELVATEYLYKEEVEAILMNFLIKGSRSFVKDEFGQAKRIQNSPLVHAYMLDSGFSTEFRLDYTRAKGCRS